jgi:hypothetical protein
MNRAFASSFRGRNLEKLDEHFRRTELEPLYIRALPTYRVHRESFQNLVSMRDKHVHHLRALHIRTVTPDLVGSFPQHTPFATNHTVTSLEEP